MSWADMTKDKDADLQTRKIELGVEEKFLETLFRYLQNSGETRVAGLHVTDILYPCSRRGYYNALMPPLGLDVAGAIRIWTGVELHKMPMLEKHEITLEWSGISGTIDEYEKGLFIDKKTTRKIPTVYDRKLGEYVVNIRDHHLRQLEYYRVLLEENGYNVDWGAVLYINVDSGEVMAGLGDIHERKLEDIESEMSERALNLKVYLDKKVLPPRDISIRWMCHKYCPYIQQCMLNVNPTSFLTPEFVDSRWSIINGEFGELTRTEPESESTDTS